MRLLSLDPSSTAIGWALLQSHHERLLECGLFRSSLDDSLRRIDRLAAELTTLAVDVAPDLVVIEWSAGKVHAGATGGREVSGLAVLGQAQGTYRATLMSLGLPVQTVLDTVWTAGCTKAGRAQIVTWEHAVYRAFAGPDGKRDPGLDVADAVGLGCWLLRRQQIAALMESMKR